MSLIDVIENSQIDHKVVTFGEILIRLSGENGRRLGESERLTRSWAGSEANVAVALAAIGFDTRFSTRIPNTMLGDACVRDLRSRGVSIGREDRSSGRFGTFYLERGAMFRAPVVLYDREYSAIAISEPSSYDWKTILKDADWFHVSGITPALSGKTRMSVVDAVSYASENNIPVSIDLNYRRLLWESPKEARKVIAEILPHCNIVIGNEEDFSIMVTGEENRIGGTVSEQSSGFAKTAESVFRMYPQIKTLYSSVRIAHSVEHNSWSGVSVDEEGTVLIAVTRELRDIVDRIGAGDAFAAGVIAGNLLGVEASEVLEIGTAMGALAHSFNGDFLNVSWDEIRSAMKTGNLGGRIKR